MLLTIGMIVKNEEKYLRQCLTAIKPILNSIDSELIIVDTGSTDRTVEIAKEFTDKVLFFEWVNDFAAARNVGLKAAQGEWFMFLDADEIFLSCDGIIDFFKSGSYKNYNSAVYSIRNFKSMTNKRDYTDFCLPRLTKIRPETEFVRPVHEAFNTFGVPIMMLSDVAEHYGYAYEDNKELENAKFERNSKLLQQRLAEEEPSPLLYKQLFDTYCSQDDKTQAIAYAYQGIELCLEQKSDFVMALYHALIVLFHSEKRYDDVLRIHDEYFALDMDIREGERSADLEIMGYKGLALFDMGRFEECYEMLSDFFRLHESYKARNFVSRETLYITFHLKNENALLKLNLILTESALKTGRYKAAEENIKLIPLKNYDFDANMRGYRIEQIVQLFAEGDCKDFIKIYKSNDSKDRADILDSLTFALLGMNEVRRRDIINKLAAEELDKAVQRNRISIHKAHFLSGGAGAARIAAFIKKFGAKHADILYIMLYEGLDISPFLDSCENIVQMVSDGFRGVKGFSEIVGSYDVSKVSDSAQLYKFVVMYLYTVVGAAENKLGIEKLTSTLGNIAMKYLESYGENELPEEVLAAVTIAEIEMLRKMRNFKECIASLRRLIQLNSRYASIAKEYQNILKADMQA